MKSHSATAIQTPALSASKSLSSSSSASGSIPSSSSSTSSFPSSSSSSTSIMRHLILSAVILLLCTSTFSEACFIRNCPIGGKRSVDSHIAQRPCMSCGPGNTGQCVGPNICCSPQFGCSMGSSPQASVCQKENESTTPCFVTGDKCGPRDSGKCVADGICCDSETCTMTDACSVDTPSSTGDQEQVLRLLERLLKTRTD